MARFGDFDQYLDNAGDPLAEGKLYFYESGTTTPKTTYADINNSIPNTNPVLLSAAGRQPNIFFNGVAKVILTDNDDVQIAVRDPAGETGTDFGDEWIATKIYNAVDVVLGSDGIYYRSLINGNQNNNPVTTTGSWTLLYSVEWNQGITYSVGDVVTYGSQQYQSLQNSNLNQNPSTQTAYWVPLNFAWVATATYSEDQNVVGTDGILYTSLQNSNIGNDPATSPAYWVGTSAAAAASAVAAAASATASASSATDSANSATDSANSATASAGSATASASSATDSANSATASASSATDSANSATASASSAAASASSATDSANSATASQSSASDSATSAAAALASETAAAASEAASATSAAASASSATDSANSATASASEASDSSTSAAASASSASDSATSASASAGSATASSGSATAAAGSATAAASSATDAANSATAAAGSATAASDKYDEFDARYLGEKASDPSVDNQGGALVEGALYFNTTSDAMKVYDGASWISVAPVATSVTVSQISDYTGTATELNYTDGVTSSIQTQLDAKVETLSDLGITATATELNYVDGVTSAIQAQIDGKEPADATILKDADIGSTVQAYDADTAKYDDATANFTGTLQNGGSNVVVDSDIGSSVLGYVAPSTSGNILTSDGTNWTSVASSGGGLEEFIAEYTLASDASTFNVDDAVFYDSSYDYILIKGSLRVTATNANFRIYYRNSSGTNQTGNYAYTTYGSSGSSNSTLGGGGQTFMQFLGVNYSIMSYPYGYTPDAYFQTRIYHNEPSLVSHTTASWQRSTNVGQQFHSGLWSGSSFTFGGIQFYASTGNVNAGSKVKIYGVKGS